MMAARALLELGHIRLAVTEELNEPGHPCDPSMTSRRLGFEAVVCEAGGLLLPEWRLLVPRRVFHHRHDWYVRKTIAAWAASPPGSRPIAFFTLTNEPFVYGKFFEEFERHRIRVPRDLSIVATSWGGKFFGGDEPARNGLRFTCIDFDFHVLIRRVFDAAEELYREKNWKPGQRKAKLFLTPALLIRGETTSPASFK